MQHPGQGSLLPTHLQRHCNYAPWLQPPGHHDGGREVQKTAEAALAKQDASTSNSRRGWGGQHHPLCERSRTDWGKLWSSPPGARRCKDAHRSILHRLGNPPGAARHGQVHLRQGGEDPREQAEGFEVPSDQRLEPKGDLRVPWPCGKTQLL